MSKGKYNGRGIYVSAKGYRYEGDWVDGNKHGHGTYQWANGDRYEGGFSDDKRSGKGMLLFADGARYEGDFVSGSFCCGKVLLRAGDQYKGFVDSQLEPTGLGVKLWADGRCYFGSFIDGKPASKGGHFLSKELCPALLEADVALPRVAVDCTRVQLANGSWVAAASAPSGEAELRRLPAKCFVSAVTNLVTPKMPDYTKQRHIYGEVVLLVTVDEQGKASDIVTVASPHSSLSESVAVAVRQWKYPVRSANDQPIKYRYIERFNFAEGG